MAVDVFISADSAKPTGAMTPADALGEPKRMSTDTTDTLECEYDTSRPVTDEKLLRNLKKFKEDLGRVPKAREMKDIGPHGVATYHKRFGSWNDALSKAGLEPINASTKAGGSGIHPYSETDIVRYLRKWFNKTGSPPSKREFLQEGPFSASVVRRVFGSWNDGLRAAGIPTRCAPPSERNGDSNPQWRGGHDRYYGPSWKPAREACLERDRYCCRNCGISNSDHREKSGFGLHVHHIKPFRNFASHEEANRLSNLITLCQHCHSKFEGVPIDNR